MFRGMLCIWAVMVALLFAASIQAQDNNFKKLVGDVRVGAVTSTDPLQVPYITWGGDMVTFYANGGLKTKPGTIFAKEGLNLKLVAGDDFVQQVRDYLSGRSPFLRGTFRMMGMASEVIGSDPRTKGMVILQLTWSAGDHMVARKDIRSVNDLRGKKIALQQGGPHVGMLDDILKTGQLKWSDIEVVWMKNLSGPGSPAEKFRKDPSVDACFVITPDMLGLSGGLKSIGSGAEGTVTGAKVLVSTAEMSRSIADVYVCRKDFYDQHPDIVRKFVAGYLKGSEDVIKLKKSFESGGSSDYMKLLKLTQEIYGKETIPTLEEDAHGLLQDCTLVGYPGNVAFFTQKNNLSGFDAMQKAALDLAVNQGYAKIRSGLFPSPLDYTDKNLTSMLSITKVERKDRFRAEAVLEEIEQLSTRGGLDDRTIVSFTINFQPNQKEFNDVQYGAEYQRLVEMANKYGNAVFAIRGHSDPTKTLLDLVRAGVAKGIIKRTGSNGNYSYSFRGRPLDLSSTGQIVKLIEAGEFDGASSGDPRQTMQAALNLSRSRAEAVRDSVIKYAAKKGLTLDESQIQPVGVGVREPFIAKPGNMDEAKKNMRVEFRLIRVEAEASSSSDFDF